MAHVAGRHKLHTYLLHIIPVSYTHLDVYKRQSQACALLVTPRNSTGAGKNGAGANDLGPQPANYRKCI